MRMPVGTKIIFGDEEMVGLLGAGILTLTIDGVTLAKEQAFLARHILPDAAQVTFAVSSSGYEFKTLSIDDGQWELEVTYEREPIEGLDPDVV